MDADEDRRLMEIAPDISRISVGMLRRVVGLEPAERVPQEALAVADEVLADFGTDGLRVLVMSLAGWAAVEIERDAQVQRRSYEAVVDDIELTCLEANPEG